MMRFTRIVFAVVTLALSASAGPITWMLNDVSLTGGVTASGTFTFDADAGTACSTGNSPCGSYSNIDITTTAGGGFSAETFLYACGNVATCTGLTPDSTEVLFLTSNAADQSGLPGIAFFFGTGGGPPAGLSDAGGTINVGGVEEGICNNAACAAPSGTTLTGTSGSAVAAPEPSSALLLGASLAGLGLLRLRGVRRRPRL